MFVPIEHVFVFLLCLLVFMLFVSLFYMPDKEKRPHKAAISFFRSLKRRRKTKYSKEEERQKAFQGLGVERWTRCPYCGTGSPGWHKREILELKETSRLLAYSVVAQTCRNCGHVQLFDADWLQSRVG